MFCSIQFFHAPGALLQGHVQEFRPIPGGSDDLSTVPGCDGCGSKCHKIMQHCCDIAELYKITKTMEILNTLQLISISTTRPFSAVLDLVSCLFAQMNKESNWHVSTGCKTRSTRVGSQRAVRGESTKPRQH
jgi:hypothetical protein